MIYRIEIEAITPVRPTEDPDRVDEAITSIFPTAEIEHAHGEARATAHSIDQFAELLARQRILETARAHLLERIEGDTVAFRLKKQAALAGVVNFALEDASELGDIAVRIRIEEPSPDHFIEELTRPGGDASDE